MFEKLEVTFQCDVPHGVMLKLYLVPFSLDSKSKNVLMWRYNGSGCVVPFPGAGCQAHSMRSLCGLSRRCRRGCYRGEMQSLQAELGSSANDPCCMEVRGWLEPV